MRPFFALTLFLSYPFLTLATNSHAQPARDLSVVGPIRLGVTSTTQLYRVYGKGRVSIGHHSDSAVEWRLRSGGSFIADGWHVSKDDNYIIDRLIWSRGQCRTHSSVALTYHGIHLGEQKARVLQELGPRYSMATAYSRTCLQWRGMRQATHQSLDIYASFVSGRLAFLAVDLVDY